MNEIIIEKHLKPIDSFPNVSSINGLDCVFLINLDQRPEKLERSLKQLTPFEIFPNRFSAIYGWTLAEQVIEDIGMKLEPGMDWRGSISLHKPWARRITAPSVGSACFYPRLSRGAIGCTLSHLSILQSALNANHQTIWILEDDFTVNADPHCLSEYIEKLDAITDKSWDILYTDDTAHFDPFTPGTVYRPDMPDIDFEPLYEHKALEDDFYHIGGRCQTHSMVIRRSGMQKILDFEKDRGIYLPYDIEISFIPGIKLFNLSQNVVCGGSIENSDTIRKNF
jgi:GR25 family glycosyltransferase involved in LPS biosynthesis